MSISGWDEGYVIDQWRNPRARKIAQSDDDRLARIAKISAEIAELQRQKNEALRMKLRNGNWDISDLETTLSPRRSASSMKGGIQYHLVFASALLRYIGARQIVPSGDGLEVCASADLASFSGEHPAFVGLEMRCDVG